jgi:uncharacterized iron-regulated membrane protein
MLNLLENPEIQITVGALVAGLVLSGAMAWLERRPRDALSPRLVPTTPLLFAGILVALLAAVHLVNLAGIHTGR